MRTETIDIQTKSGSCDSFVALPGGAGPFPAVLFLMDAFGLRPWLEEMAEAIAAKGYYVLVPNLFYRTRRSPVVKGRFPAKPEDMPALHEQIMPLVRSLNAEQMMEDVESFLDFLSRQKEVRAEKVALTGYCMGGRMGFRAAAEFPDRVAAVASFHGGNLATEAPDSPHLLLPEVRAELYFGHADNDKSMPKEQIERLENALKQSGRRYESELYTGAAHGFTMRDLPAYNEGALERHWEKLFALLERALKQ
jgi:carboxymethylenebutenolidase